MNSNEDLKQFDSDKRGIVNLQKRLIDLQ